MKYLPAVLALVLVIASCGGGSSSSSNTVSIAITPTAVTLTPNQTAQFTATVSNSSNTAVTWQVNGTEGGNVSVGTISTAGAYTAPAAVSVQLVVTITAIAQADTTKTATATVTLNPPTTAPTSPVVVSPPSATLSAGAQQTFTATVTGSSANVTWTVTCPAQNQADCGTITQAGVYTAPFFPPPSGSATVTATSNDNTGLPGNAPVAIKISNQSLFGPYAFSLLGRSGGTTTTAAGSITFDGQGNVSSVVEDVSGSGTTLSITGGTYHIGTDGRGSVTFQTSAGTTNWQIVMQGRSRIYVTSFNSGPPAYGTLELQTTSAFSASSITGAYSFRFAGASLGNATGTLLSAGAVTADGVGSLSAGLLDVNDTGSALTNLPLTGSFVAPDSHGRGTLTLTSTAGSPTYVYYIVDGTRLKLMETDATATGIAEMVQQATGPFTTASVKAAYVTALIGANTSGPASTGGIFSLDGVGGVKAAIDMNVNGNTALAQSLTGTYSVTDPTTGRTTISWSASDGAHQYVLYPSQTGSAVMLEVDSASASGPALTQSTTVNNGSFSGNFAAKASGIDFAGTPGTVAFSGQTVFNGGSALTGTLDINDAGATSAGTAARGSYLFDSTGRATLNITSGAPGFASALMQMYAVDGTRALFINSDSNRVLTGEVRKQY